MSIITLEAALESLLTDDATVSGMVVDRVYRGIATQEETLPYIVFENDGGDPPDKALSGPTGMASRDVVIDCRAASGAEATNLAAAVMFLLDGYRGDVDGFAIDLIDCMEPSTSDENDVSDGIFGERISATVKYRRPKGNQQ